MANVFSYILLQVYSGVLATISATTNAYTIVIATTILLIDTITGRNSTRGFTATVNKASGETIVSIVSYHYVNVSVLIKFSQKTSVFTSIIISSP